MLLRPPSGLATVGARNRRTGPFGGNQLANGAAATVILTRNRADIWVGRPTAHRLSGSVNLGNRGEKSAGGRLPVIAR